MMDECKRALPEGYAIADARWRDLNKDQQKKLLKILKDGGAVSVPSAKQTLPNATIVLLRHHDAIVGVGAIKPERMGYAKDKQSPQESGYAFDPKVRELGYVVVHDDHRDKNCQATS